MRIEVVIGTEDELKNAVAAPECPESGYKAYYLEKLQKSADEQKDVIDFHSIVPSPTPSANFQSMGIIERAMVEHLTANKFPEKVRIICKDEETARMYKVVYNYFFAETKLDRLEDENWD